MLASRRLFLTLTSTSESGKVHLIVKKTVHTPLGFFCKMQLPQEHSSLNSDGLQSLSVCCHLRASTRQWLGVRVFLKPAKEWIGQTQADFRDVLGFGAKLQVSKRHTWNLQMAGWFLTHLPWGFEEKREVRRIEEKKNRTGEWERKVKGARGSMHLLRSGEVAQTRAEEAPRSSSCASRSSVPEA